MTARERYLTLADALDGAADATRILSDAAIALAGSTRDLAAAVERWRQEAEGLDAVAHALWRDRDREGPAGACRRGQLEARRNARRIAAAWGSPR